MPTPCCEWFLFTLEHSLTYVLHRSGCATWPAFWTVAGQNWPQKGKIDIVKGVNKQTNNQMTLPSHLCHAQLWLPSDCYTHMCILALLCSSHNVALPMAPMLMHMCPDPNHTSSSPPPHPGEPPHRLRHAMSHPMTTQDMPHSSGHAPAPLTCLALSQRATAIPHASHTPFMCPNPIHDLTHMPQPPSMCPNAFQHTHPFSTHCKFN